MSKDNEEELVKEIKEMIYLSELNLVQNIRKSEEILNQTKQCFNAQEWEKIANSFKKTKIEFYVIF